MKQQKMNTNKETGRSMVEMLGVLAVIGVLSIGGIAGYTMAMNRHRANELLDGASKRAVVAMQQISLGKSASEVSLGEFTSNVVAGGTFSGNVLDLDGGEIGIQVSGIEKAVCENLVNMVSGDVEVVKVVSADEVTDMEASDCSDTASNNTLAIVFKDSGSGAGAGADDDDDEYHSPRETSCDGFEDDRCAIFGDGAGCLPEGPGGAFVCYCVSGECSAKSDHPGCLPPDTYASCCDTPGYRDSEDGCICEHFCSEYSDHPEVCAGSDEHAAWSTDSVCCDDKSAWYDPGAWPTKPCGGV